MAVDGLDSSADMLERLRGKAQKLGLNSIETFKMPMSEFILPRRYDSIIITSGSFQILISEQEALGCLRSVRVHLAKDGFFLMDVFVPWDSIKAEKAEDFSVNRDSQRDDGSRCVVSERFNVDCARQVVNSVFRYEVYRDNKLEQTLINDFPLRWYWKDEISNLILRAGFTKVEFLTHSSLYEDGSIFVMKAS